MAREEGRHSQGFDSPAREQHPGTLTSKDFMRAGFHRLFLGHWPEYVDLAFARICLVCDVGTPTGSSIQGLLPANSLSPMKYGLGREGAIPQGF